ncbi:2OG-Fe(II) oxygenase [Legionella nautarum]|uniref:2OG-Fe(II) oxygenase n=1 Tax=Legionella nautarum TaxID=45070 RepID=A0A0W0X3N1_9GAMM|nr:2OG-Fe(II) oxygenase [Legionella nautarum]KTD39187.1 2OG-Fe(II) oxygenase [Legionella nautarum]
MNTQIEDEICEKGFHIIDNFLEPQDFALLSAKAELMHSQGQFKGAKIGHRIAATHNADIRRDEICWLDDDSSDRAINAYFNKIRAIADRLNQTLFLGLVDFETHFAIYQPGSFYKKHVDQFISTQARRISCVYYLNESWQEAYAGQLKLFDKNDQLLANVLPRGNRFICFNSDLPHEVCETKHPRYSIAGWMKTRSMSVIF